MADGERGDNIVDIDIGPKTDTVRQRIARLELIKQGILGRQSSMGSGISSEASTSYDRAASRIQSLIDQGTTLLTQRNISDVEFSAFMSADPEEPEN